MNTLNWEFDSPNDEYDFKVKVVEDALYSVKNADYALPEDVKLIDALLAADCSIKVGLLDQIFYHAEQAA